MVLNNCSKYGCVTEVSASFFWCWALAIWGSWAGSYSCQTISWWQIWLQIFGQIPACWHEWRSCMGSQRNEQKSKVGRTRDLYNWSLQEGLALWKCLWSKPTCLLALEHTESMWAVQERLLETETPSRLLKGPCKWLSHQLLVNVDSKGSIK